MAYETYEEDNYGDVEGALDGIRSSLEKLEEQIKTMAEESEDSNSAVRLDIGQSRREMIQLRSSLQRLQARFDNQLTVLVLGNIASGVGVAAIVLAASQGLH